MTSHQIALYPFSYFDLMRRKWMRAKYRAGFGEIAERYGCFRIEGPPEVRNAPADPLNMMFRPR